ncbi:hypothetical protein BGZ65_011588, partial [Modicella reniformis]
MDTIGIYSSRKPLDIKERYGEYPMIISRKELCSILADHVPHHKIKFGKRVLEIRQNSGEVIVQCSDKSVHHADILVGADGAYSAVRQCLHNSLDAKGLLPKHDTTPMGYQYDCLVRYQDKGKKYAEETIFKQSDWGEDAAEQMCREYRGLRTSYGFDMGYLMDRTPKEDTAKVMLEEKFYKTWFSGRVVLTGD